MTQQTKLEQSYLILIRFLMLSKRRLMELGDQYDLTGVQTMTLFLLDEPRPMHSFKKIYNCDASNVTGIIDGLEAKALVERFEDPTDRRVKTVRLTTKGKRLRSTLIKHLTIDSPLLSKLSPAELTTFTQLLETITSPAESPAGLPTRHPHS